MNDKNKIFSCAKCGAQFTKWTGRCLSCLSWGTIVQESGITDQESAPALQKLEDFASQKENQRILTNLSEMDRVLGGGIVQGSLILLGGEPGIGKSTLLLQLCKNIANTIYVSAEENYSQVQMRAGRIGLNSPLKFSEENNVDKIIALLIKEKPTLAIIDSIQTVYSDEVQGETGSLSQVRACAVKLLETAKKNNITIIMVGHVTKDGQVAGPKTLEHLVDTVLYLEGDSKLGLRLLRSVKNRFGATDEIGVFDMKSSGLEEIKNPSAVFLQGVDQTIPGSVVTVISEGTRSFLVEVQSIVSKTNFGLPQRKTSGYDSNRLSLLLAVLSKRMRLDFSGYDVYLNIIGGLKIKEVSVDLAICMSLISSYKDKVLDKNIVAVGEVGLGGEIRPIPYLERRISEAKNLGFEKIYTPKCEISPKDKIKIIQITNLKDLIK